MKLDVPYKLTGSIPRPLIEEALSLIKPEHWYVDGTRNTMGNLTSTQSILLRYFDSYNDDVFKPGWQNKLVDKPLYEEYRSVVEKILFVLKKYYTFSEYIAFFAKLNAKSKVGNHIDDGEFLETCHRVHIPIKTNSDVYYIIEGVKYNWVTGNIYEFDNTRMHGVQNNSSEDRIHLMFNLYR